MTTTREALKQAREALENAADRIQDFGGSSARHHGYVLGSDAARAVGRFRAGGPIGFIAKSASDPVIRTTREEAINDERQCIEHRLKGTQWLLNN